MKITYLGPAGATFSAVAYNELSRLFRVPSTNDEGIELVLAKTNDEIDCPSLEPPEARPLKDYFGSFRIPN